MPSDSAIVVRDSRFGNWLWLENVIVDKYAAKIGTTATVVYLGLVRFANKESQTCFPSQDTLSKTLGICERSIRTALSTLERHKLIVRQRRKHGKVTEYVLVSPDRSEQLTIDLERQNLPVNSFSPASNVPLTRKNLNTEQERAGSPALEPAPPNGHKTTPDPETIRRLCLYRTLYEQKYGVKLLKHEQGKCVRVLGRVSEASPAVFDAALSAFFANGDDYTRKARHPIELFVSNFSRYTKPQERVFFSSRVLGHLTPWKSEGRVSAIDGLSVSEENFERLFQRDTAICHAVTAWQEKTPGGLYRIPTDKELGEIVESVKNGWDKGTWKRQTKWIDNASV